MVHGEQQQHINKMVEVSSSLETKYKAGSHPEEKEEDGAIISPTFPRIEVDFALVARANPSKLPQPDLFAVQGCSADANFFTSGKSQFDNPTTLQVTFLKKIQSKESKN